MKLSITLAVLALGMFLISRVGAREIGFIEDFGLAKDRAEVLKQLIPGTSDYYYYHCLYAQHVSDVEQVNQMLDLWIKRYGYTPQVKEIMNRQALLDYEKDPEKSLAHIRKELDLRFDHRKETAGRQTDHPTALDQELISISQLMKNAFSRHKNLDGIEDVGLDMLPHDQLNPERRRDLLHRLQRPDVPGLAKLVKDDLRHKHSRGFGSHPIHVQMLKSQLDQCLRLMSDLLEDSAFIHAYLSKLTPSDDVDIRYDLAEKRAYLERLWAFAETLDPAHNSLKAHILFRILDMNRNQGDYDHDRFMTYIRLPRNVSYMEPEYLRKRRLHKADLNADFSAATRMPAVGTDEELVRDYLSHFFVTAKNIKPYVKFIQDTFLKDIFVETKIVNGIGDMEQWYAMMTPDRHNALKERVDLDFAQTNETFFVADEPVRLDLHVKNIETLIVKLFEINTFTYYQTHLQEVDTAVNLDGLAATHEEVIEYDETPLRRIRRSFEFPQINRPGVFVAEFIGNGKSSRAVIRKGKRWYHEQIGPAGHEFTIRDERNQKRPDASIWMAGREYRPGEDGVVIIPFSNQPGTQTMILKEQDFCSLASFVHQSEDYSLSAGFYVDRESLLRRFHATVVIRPVLSLNGHPISLSLLENVRLLIESADQEEVSTVKEVSGFKLFEEKEATYEFQVPENLANITFTLKAEVQNMSRNKKENMSDSATFPVNGIDATLTVEDIFLSRANDAYLLAILGRNGEPKPDRAVQVELKHRCFREKIYASLQTDTEGRVHLGKLEGIEWIRASEAGENPSSWHLVGDRRRHPANFHGRTGEVIQIPYVGSTAKEPRLSYTLLERRGGTWVANHKDAVQVHDGFLKITGIPSGDYDLFLKESGTKMAIRLTKGEAEDGFLLSENRILEVKEEFPLHIRRVDMDESAVQVQLGNASASARVHVFGTRFMPSFDGFSHLVYGGLPEPRRIRLNRPESQYVEGRNIGDEYRYILDRKYAEKFPGNMLKRPEVLLNPWSIRKTETTRDDARGGDQFASAAPSQEMREMAAFGDEVSEKIREHFSNPDFLAETTALLLNLKPDENGGVTINRNDLGAHTQIRVIAVDLFNTVCREIALPDTEMKTRDLRLIQHLAPDAHFTEQKQISAIRAGETFRVTDITTTEFEVYDSLEKVYDLLVTMSQDDTLQEFWFIPDWSEMDDAEKQEKYSEFACHEFSFFLFHKDLEFFARVIRPYLRNKKDKTFMDHWLLEDDLTRYLEPWAFSQLNIVEQILLARRGPGEKDQIARHVKDRFDMIPPDVDAYNWLFDTALKGRAFDEDEFGFEAAKEDVSLRGSRAQMDAMIAITSDSEADELDFDMALEAEDEKSARSLGISMLRSSGERMKAKKMRKSPAKQAFAPPRRDERRAARQFFQKLDKTKEWVENNYYQLPIEEQNADMITVNAFWNDFARFVSVQEQGMPFLSKNFIYATENFSDMMLALSVLDLPFKPGTHEPTVKDVSFILKAGGPMIVCHKEIQPAQPAEEKLPILASQHFFRSNDRYEHVGNERFDKVVADEFLLQTAYGCQVILSNPTSSRQKLRMLLQIPQGAMPLKSGFYTRGMPVTLEPYATQTFDYHFYFPELGRFPHYPVQAAKNEQFVASAAPATFNVVAELSRRDTESWDYLSQEGKEAEVLAFIRDHNLNRIDLNKIAFRMKEKAFFEAVIRLLKERHAYHHTLWSYGIHHKDQAAISEYLRHAVYANRCGLFIETPLLTIDPVVRKTYQHKEYKPLVNARAHSLGKRRKILNDRFHDQYQQFMRYLSYRPALDDADRIAVTYYLLLQDRVSEAIRFFKRIDPETVQTRMQYDYLRAYLDFYTENPESAWEIAAAYLDHPVPKWRKLFQHVADQLDELAGKAAPVADKESREQIQARLAATEASLEFKVESRQVTITYQNLSGCRVNYYPMEIELLFSRNPFVQQQTAHFAFIRPSDTEAHDLPAGQTVATFELPEKFRNSNLMVEIVAGGMRKSQAYYANSLEIQVIENYGHIKAGHQETHQPLAKVYVKVYARMNGGDVRFYKDGYTDIRGRFDYASLSTNELDHVERFAILILSEAYGAVIREASPPQR